MKKVPVIVLLTLLACVPVAANPTSYFSPSPTRFATQSLLVSNFSNTGGFGYLNNGGISTPVFRWNPDFNYGPVSMGFDINVPLYNSTTVGVDSMVVRYVEYSTPKWGVKYGLLKEITYASGLLLSNYTPLLKGGLIPSDQQASLRAYYTQGIYGAEVLGTWSRVYGARVTEQVLPYLTLGQYFICDTDGVTQVRPDGSTKIFPAQSGWGVDATAPFLFGSNCFAEYAKLNNHGGGFSAGVMAGYDLWLARLTFKAEKRYIDYNFVPEYYNEEYETNPVDIVSFEASSQNKDGYKLSVSGDMLATAKFWAVLEGYNNSNSALKAEASADLGAQYFAAAGYYQPNFVDARSLDLKEGSIITTRLGYKINPFTQIIANAKSAYDPDQGKVVVTQWYEVTIKF